MAVLMELDLPFGTDVIEAVSAEMGVREAPPEGLVGHVVTDRGGSCHVVDIWEKQQQFESFRDNRLMPAMQKVLSERSIALPEGGLDPQFTPAQDLVRGR
jgi:hypothetical protein